VTKAEALKLIDDHKNVMINPVAMLHWTWLRVIILNITDDQWEQAVGKATETLSQ
jgi:hypothetical protein